MCNREIGTSTDARVADRTSPLGGDDPSSRCTFQHGECRVPCNQKVKGRSLFPLLEFKEPSRVGHGVLRELAKKTIAEESSRGFQGCC